MSFLAERELKKLNQQTALVVGDFMVDEYLYGVTTRISPEAPVPVVHIRKKFAKLGGAGNVVCNLIALGAKTRVVMEVGADTNGDFLFKQLQEHGADLTYANQRTDFRTIVKTRIMAQNQQLLRFDEETIVPVSDGYLEKIKTDVDKLFQGVSVVILSDYGKGMITQEMAAYIIAEAEKRRIPVTVDPKGSDYSKYNGATVCTPNLKELTEAAGAVSLQTEEEIFQAAAKVCESNNIHYMLTTRSEKGMSLQERHAKNKLDYPVVSKEVIDVTGAGDTVISMFSLCFAAGFPLDECCRLSNIAASIVVSKIGTATATQEEILSQIQMRDDHLKIISREELPGVIAKLRSTGKKIVFTNGCFDLVHAGHVALLRQAHSFGDVLILGVNSDASIKRIKGEKRPIVDQDNRLKLLEAIDAIDYIVLFEEDTPQQLIETVIPDVLVKGEDWKDKKVIGSDIVCAHGGCVKLVKLREGLSTTQIIKKILTVYGESR